MIIRYPTSAPGAAMSDMFSESALDNLLWNTAAEEAVLSFEAGQTTSLFAQGRQLQHHR